MVIYMGITVVECRYDDDAFFLCLRHALLLLPDCLLLLMLSIDVLDANVA